MSPVSDEAFFELISTMGDRLLTQTSDKDERCGLCHVWGFWAALMGEQEERCGPRGCGAFRLH